MVLATSGADKLCGVAVHPRGNSEGGMAAGRMAAPGGVAGIHAMPRHEFPVLNEQFLVDVNYDFVKELGQGKPALSCRLSSHTADGVRALIAGAYGVVCAAKHRVTGDAVAIKKVRTSRLDTLAAQLTVPRTALSLQVTKIFTKRILTKRALRELKLLHHFRNHKNVRCCRAARAPWEVHRSEGHGAHRCTPCTDHLSLRHGRS